MRKLLRNTKRAIYNSIKWICRLALFVLSIIWEYVDRFYHIFPIIIIITWISTFLILKNTEFYAEHYYLLNFIDTIIVVTSIIHAFFKAKNYLKVTRNCLKGMISIVVLQKAYYDFELSDYTYYFFYIFVMVMIVLKSIYDNLNNKI